jgi:hypothetical protein
MSTDKSPTASSPDLKTGNNLANLSSEQRLEIQETLRTDGSKGLDQSLQKENQGGWQKRSLRMVAKNN